MKYYTPKQIQEGLRKCGAPQYVTLNRIRQYIIGKKLTKEIDNIDIDEKIKKRYIYSGTKNFIPSSNLSKIINGFNLQVKLSDLEKAMEQ